MPKYLIVYLGGNPPTSPEEGNSFKKWKTPIKDYKDFNGRKVASYGEAIWFKPAGEFCYAQFNLMEIKYNCREYE